ncbi:hypothetical protein [Streptomyces sp. NBC_01205]|uniref:hypothetical protein n=1 Tax=Streptomyces sp. NBC_01205 TaxID=2903771 RepID=UPI002E106117|nr:hypothetical protein OG573_43150 [Streptomyces sp. NBC_01205]
MFTARLNRIAAAGTDHGFVTIRLADDRTLNVKAEPASTILEEVYLSPGITVPDTEAWENEDDLELFLNGETCGGSVYLDVPIEAVRDLIQQHGGEHADQDNVDFPPVDYQIHPLNDAGHYPVYRGTQRIGRIARRGKTWHTLLLGGTRWAGEFTDSEQAAYHLLELADLAAGRATTAEQDLRKALAAYSLTAHRDEDTPIGWDRTSWLIIGPGNGGSFPDMGEEPYFMAYLHNPADGDEVTIDRAARVNDEWVTIVGSGDQVEKGPATVEGRSFPGRDVAALAAYIADWHRAPRTVRAEALSEFRARRIAALNLAGQLPT